jgi:hypothetical protein
VRLSTPGSANRQRRRPPTESMRLDPLAEPHHREEVGEWLRQTRAQLFGKQPTS